MFIVIYRLFFTYYVSSFWGVGIYSYFVSKCKYKWNVSDFDEISHKFKSPLLKSLFRGKYFQLLFSLKSPTFPLLPFPHPANHPPPILFLFQYLFPVNPRPPLLLPRYRLFPYLHFLLLIFPLHPFINSPHYTLPFQLFSFRCPPPSPFSLFLHCSPPFLSGDKIKLLLFNVEF